MAKFHKFVLMVVGALLPVVAAADTIVSQADTWNYNQSTSLGGSGALGAITFTDFTNGYTGAQSGQAAFGNTDITDAPVNTTWDASSALYLQKTVDLSGSLTEDATLNLAVDNAAAVWVNGALVFNQDAGGFTSIWEYTESVDSSLFLVGNNVISVIANDYGGLTYFDMELTASVVPIPAAAWLFGSALLGLIGLARRKQS